MTTSGGRKFGIVNKFLEFHVAMYTKDISTSSKKNLV